MPELKLAITIVEIIVAVMVLVVLGDFLGDRTGRWRLAKICGGIALVSIIDFAVYAAIILISEENTDPHRINMSIML